LREKSRRIVGSDTPPDVPLKSQQGRASNLRSYRPIPGLRPYHNEKEKEREREKTNLAFTLAGADASGEFVVHPTLWGRWNGWMKIEIINNGYVTEHDAIHESARIIHEACGYGTSVTTRRYLKDAIGDGKHGDYVKVWSPTLGRNIIKFSDKLTKRMGLLETYD
jgi:hypothetical protein